MAEVSAGKLLESSEVVKMKLDKAPQKEINVDLETKPVPGITKAEARDEAKGTIQHRHMNPNLTKFSNLLILLHVNEYLVLYP